MQNRRQNDLVCAGFFTRLAAYFIDALLVTMLLAVVRVPIWAWNLFREDLPISKAVVFRFSLLDVVIYLLGVAYFIITTYKTGSTLGKSLLGVKVVSAEGRLTLLNVCYRETIGRYLSSVFLYIGYILVGVDAEKRGLHDMLCDTRVVYKNMVRAPRPMPYGVPPRAPIPLGPAPGRPTSVPLSNGSVSREPEPNESEPNKATLGEPIPMRENPVSPPSGEPQREFDRPE